MWAKVTHFAAASIAKTKLIAFGLFTAFSVRHTPQSLHNEKGRGQQLSKFSALNLMCPPPESRSRMHRFKSIFFPSANASDTTRFNMDFSAHSILWILLIGLIVGAIAKLLTPGRDPGGCIVTILLGIAGAVVASYLGQAVGWYRPGEPAGVIGSVVGAILLLLLYRLLFR